MKYWVLHKEGKTKISGNSLFRNADFQLCVWENEAIAEEFAKEKKSSWESWRVRPANSNDFKPVRRLSKYRKNYLVMDQDKKMAKKKVVSTGMLVEVFEDYESRRFAVASKATSEAEFITELSQALGSSHTDDWTTRLRELIPLAVDLCCKYRGYKAETVQERRELVAGDLQMPNRQEGS